MQVGNAGRSGTNRDRTKRYRLSIMHASTENRHAHSQINEQNEHAIMDSFVCLCGFGFCFFFSWSACPVAEYLLWCVQVSNFVRTWNRPCSTSTMDRWHIIFHSSILSQFLEPNRTTSPPSLILQHSRRMPSKSSETPLEHVCDFKTESASTMAICLDQLRSVMCQEWKIWTFYLPVVTFRI